MSAQNGTTDKDWTLRAIKGLGLVTSSDVRVVDIFSVTSYSAIMLSTNSGPYAAYPSVPVSFEGRDLKQ